MSKYSEYGNEPVYAYAAPQHAQYQQPAVSVQPLKPQVEAPTGWRDLPFAILFYINVAAIAVLMIIWGFPALNEEPQEQKTSDSSITGDDGKRIAGAAVVLAGIAAAVSLLMIRLIVAYAKVMITVALWGSVVLYFALAAFAAVRGIVVLAVIAAILGFISLCYAYLVRKRIPFATANLQVAAEAVKKHSTMYCVAFSVIIMQVVWIFMWSLAFVGVQEHLSEKNENASGLDNDLTCELNSQCRSNFCNSSNRCASEPIQNTSYAAYFFMLISFYWGLTVVKNISHVTVAGTVASWWFHVESKGSTGSALKRSLTTSFGSICFGSLIVAILKALRQIAQEAQDQGDACACIAVCILQCIESLIEYFNKWAFTYVGIYGYKFTQAGKAVIDLFKQRGFDAIINDDLIGNVLGLTSFAIGLICAGLGAAFASATDTFTFENATLIVAIIGFFVGVGVSIIPLSVIDSSVATVFVCYAEDPAIFARNRPELYQPLTQAWYDLYPDVMASSGYYYA